MAWSQCGVGRAGVAACDHVVPSQSQVSLVTVFRSSPPNSTTRLRTASYAIVWPSRPGGFVAGVRWDIVTEGCGATCPKSSLAVNCAQPGLADPYRRLPDSDICG